MLQVTLLFDVPVTDAVNCWVRPAGSVAVGGEMLTAMGAVTVMPAVADFVGSAWLVATTWQIPAEAGAV
jgi:hypothetical protein